MTSYRDEDYGFGPGSWGRFGRDDTEVHIPVWEQLLGTSLSRTAGELWCSAGEMWVRNLSHVHEIAVAGPSGPPQLLPPRTARERGRACSIPLPEGVVSAPTTGDWALAIRATGPLRRGAGGDSDDLGEATTRTVGPVPPELELVAAALCAPILTHGEPPADYEHVAAVLGLSYRQARRKVERLCEHYREQVPDLLPGLVGDGHAHYAPVAHLLVARGRVTRADLAALRTSTATQRTSRP